MHIDGVSHHSNWVQIWGGPARKLGLPPLLTPNMLGFRVVMNNINSIAWGGSQCVLAPPSLVKWHGRRANTVGEERMPWERSNYGSC